MVCRNANPRYRRGASLFSLVSTRHTQTQLCGNHGQFVKAPIPDIKEAPVFSASSAPITRKLSFAKITGNLSKRQSQISKKRQSFSASSTPITRTLSLMKITDNLSKKF
ncbi:hypothetical protein ACFX2I_032244 [Malus domestica]